MDYLAYESKLAERLKEITGLKIFITDDPYDHRDRALPRTFIATQLYKDRLIGQSGSMQQIEQTWLLMIGAKAERSSLGKTPIGQIVSQVITGLHDWSPGHPYQPAIRKDTNLSIQRTAPGILIFPMAYAVQFIFNAKV